MLKPISIFLVLALTALALVVSGCGSDDAPTKAVYIKEAEAICKKVSDTEEQQQGEYTQKNFARFKRGLSDAEADKSVAIIVRTIRVPGLLKEVEELEALDQPEGDEETLEKIFTGTEEGAQKLKEDPQLALASKGNNPLFPTFQMGRDYGFLNCAES